MSGQESSPSARLAGTFAVLVSLAAAPALAVTDPWTTHGPWGGTVTSIVALPGNPTTLLAGTAGGVFRTTDGAVTWTDSSQGLENLATGAMSTASDGQILAGTERGVFRSSDAGNSWTFAGPPPGSLYPIRFLAADAGTSTIWYGAAGSIIYRTTDAGATWAPFYCSTDVRGLAGGVPGMTFAATTSGILRTTDSGSTWGTSGLQGTFPEAIAVDPLTRSRVFVGTKVGLFVSIDSGMNWTQFSAVTEHVYGLGVRGSRIWVETASQFMRSIDSGLTWIAIPDGASDRKTFFTPVPPTNDVFSGDRSLGVLKSTDAGDTWAASSSGIAATYVSALASNQFPGTIIVGTDTVTRQSTDRGLTWTHEGWFAYDIASGKDQSFLVLSVGGTTFHISADGGVWDGFHLGSLWAFRNAVDASGWPIAYIGSLSEGIARTTDGGVTWSPPVSFSDTAYLTALTASPTESGRIWVGTDHGVFLSIDAGETFDPASAGLPDASIVPFAWDAAGRLFAASGGRNIYRSVDGSTWTFRSTREPCASVQDLRAHPYRTGDLYAAESCGVFRSTDAGATWSSFGLAGRRVNRLAIGSNGTILHAGLFGGGVWERSLVDPVSFYTLAPCRLVDTRDPVGPLGGPSLAAGAIRTFALAGACGVPADAKSLAVNVTIVNPTTDGDLRLFPGDEIAPLASTINFRAGQVRANNSSLAVSQDGTASLNVQADLASGSVDLLVDVVGFYR